jgi:hypothetical protein
VQDDQVSQPQACWTDPIIASLILYSLLENAADALKDTANPQIRLSIRKQDGGVVLRIEDNGRGIPEANRSKLFTFGLPPSPTAWARLWPLPGCASASLGQLAFGRGTTCHRSRLRTLATR